jgi:hypothetical protein
MPEDKEPGCTNTRPIRQQQAFGFTLTVEQCDYLRFVWVIWKDLAKGVLHLD